MVPTSPNTANIPAGMNFPVEEKRTTPTISRMTLATNEIKAPVLY